MKMSRIKMLAIVGVLAVLKEIVPPTYCSNQPREGCVRFGKETLGKVLSGRFLVCSLVLLLVLIVVVQLASGSAACTAGISHTTYRIFIRRGGW